jgi:(2Fe-2S) ferredoxin
MTRIHSMEDLVNAREQALETQQILAQANRVHIRIGMASCSIAAGARETFHAINGMIESDEIPGVSAAQIHISQTGCIGLCAFEPLVQVQIVDQPPITYGKVTPDVAHQILHKHIGKGLVVQEYVVENI